MRILSLVLLALCVAEAHAFEGARWPETPPVEAARSPAALEALEGYAFDAAEAHIRTDGLVITRGGRLVYERYARGYDADKPHLTWSVSKSFTGALIGIAAHQGRLRIDDPVRKTSDWEGAPALAPDLTWRHLLTMSSGIAWEETYEVAPLKSSVVAMLYTRGRRDMPRFVAGLPRESPPGARWAYSSGDSTLLHGLLRDVIGRAAYPDWPWVMLFDKLGMRRVVWETDGAGHYVGSSYLYMRPRDMARFGQLLLQDGVWRGERLLPEGWVAWSCRPNPAFLRSFEEGVERATQPYGAQLWLNAEDPSIGLRKAYPDAPSDACMALGHWRQMIAVLPTQRMVIVRVAHDRGGSARETNNAIIKRALAAFGPEGGR